MVRDKVILIMEMRIFIMATTFLDLSVRSAPLWAPSIAPAPPLPAPCCPPLACWRQGEGSLVATFVLGHPGARGAPLPHPKVAGLLPHRQPPPASAPLLPTLSWQAIALLRITGGGGGGPPPSLAPPKPPAPP